jgi:hypothetical protein
MQTKHILSAFFVIASLSCHKGTPPEPYPPTDSAKVKLKDINESHLPSPFYHFEYNDSGDIILAGFSSGLGIYDLFYADKRLQKMICNTPANKDTLKYEYANGDVSVIRIVNKAGITYRRAFLSYTPTHQLQTLDWEIKDGNIGFAQEQTLQLSYYPDGNLKALVTHYYTVGSQTEAIYTDKFEDYDGKVNVDAFSLLHSDHHHLFLLPGVKIQLNNPRRGIRTGDGINYDVDYTYTYDPAGRPLVRNGDLVWRSGADSGKHFGMQTMFSYYD